MKALLLAAGEGRRLGYHKMLRSIAGRSMIFWTLDSLTAAGFLPKDIIVVIGYNSSQTEGILKSYDASLNVVKNPDYKNEMFSSIKTGISFVPESCNHVLIALGDQPLVKPETIKAILEKGNPLKVVQPTYNGKRYHPLLIPRSLIEAIRRAPIHFTLKDLMPPPEDRILISVDDEGVALDVDTPDDLQRAEILLKARLKGLT